MRPRRFVPVLVSCAAVALTGCGGSSLLDGGSASELQDSLSSVRAAIDNGQCSDARRAAREGTEKVDQLPSSVDAELKDSLKSGFQDLTSRVASDCQEADAATTTTAPPTTTTAPPADTTTTDDSAPDTDPVDPGPTDTAPLEPPSADPTEPADPTTPGDDGTDGTDDDSGGVAPGVDGPGATQRSAPGNKGAAKDLRKRLKDARKRVEKYLRGQGPG